MTRYRTSFEGTKLHDEVYECEDCGKQYDSYNQLHHISEDTGGFCWCGSENLKVLVLKTIYQELWVEQSLPTEDVLEVATDLERWELIPYAIRLKGEQT